MSGHVRRIAPRSDWRSARADSFEADAAVIEEGLERLADLEALVEHNAAAAAAIRAAAAHLRTCRNDLDREAGRLRAALQGAAAEAAAQEAG